MPSISFIHSLIHSLIRTFIHSFPHSFIPTLIYSFPHSFPHSFIHSFPHLFIPIFINFQVLRSIFTGRISVLSQSFIDRMKSADSESPSPISSASPSENDALLRSQLLLTKALYFKTLEAILLVIL